MPVPRLSTHPLNNCCTLIMMADMRPSYCCGSSPPTIVHKPSCRSIIDSAPNPASCWLQALRGESVSYPADLWALGCIIYQMLVGKPPFRGASEYLTFQLVAAGDYSVPDALDPSARDVIGKLLLLDPQQRLGAPC